MTDSNIVVLWENVKSDATRLDLTVSYHGKFLVEDQ